MHCLEILIAIQRYKSIDSHWHLKLFIGWRSDSFVLFAQEDQFSISYEQLLVRSDVKGHFEVSSPWSRLFFAPVSFWTMVFHFWPWAREPLSEPLFKTRNILRCVDPLYFLLTHCFSFPKFIRLSPWWIRLIFKYVILLHIHVFIKFTERSWLLRNSIFRGLSSSVVSWGSIGYFSAWRARRCLMADWYFFTNTYFLTTLLRRWLIRLLTLK